MTPNETKLTDAMASALAIVDPVIAQALKPHIDPPKEALLSPKGPIAFYMRKQNVIVLTNSDGENCFVSPEVLAALNDFAVRIGWQTD